MSTNSGNKPLWRFFGVVVGIFTFIYLGLPFLLSAVLPHSDLVDAASAQDWQKVRLLISQGVNVNGTDERDHTALMYAATYGRTDIIQLLVAHGADVNATDNIGGTAIMCAGERPHVQAILQKAGEKH